MAASEHTPKDNTKGHEQRSALKSPTSSQEAFIFAPRILASTNQVFRLCSSKEIEEARSRTFTEEVLQEPFEHIRQEKLLRLAAMQRGVLEIIQDNPNTLIQIPYLPTNTEFYRLQLDKNNQEVKVLDSYMKTTFGIKNLIDIFDTWKEEFAAHLDPNIKIHLAAQQDMFNSMTNFADILAAIRFEMHVKNTATDIDALTTSLMQLYSPSYMLQTQVPVVVTSHGNGDGVYINHHRSLGNPVILIEPNTPPELDRLMLYYGPEILFTPQNIVRQIGSTLHEKIHRAQDEKTGQASNARLSTIKSDFVEGVAVVNVLHILCEWSKSVATSNPQLTALIDIERKSLRYIRSRRLDRYDRRILRAKNNVEIKKLLSLERKSYVDKLSDTAVNNMQQRSQMILRTAGRPMTVELNESINKSPYALDK